MKRCVALLLVLLQLITMIPVAAFADENVIAEETVISETMAETIALEETMEETAVPEESLAEAVPETTVSVTEPEETVPAESTETEELIQETVMEPAVADAVMASGSCGPNLTWTLSDGVLTITGTGAMETSYNAPWNKDKKYIQKLALCEGITGISSRAFYNCAALTEVVIPDSVTSIGDSAFAGCSNLQRVTLSANMTRIGSLVFSDCTSLASIEIPEGVLQIRSRAFSESGLSNIVLPESLTTIDSYAFEDCDSLIEIDIPASVNVLSMGAFQACDNLERIIIAESNSRYTSVDGVVFNKTADTLCMCPEGVAGAYEIPAGVVTIGKEAFYLCDKLTYVTVPDSVTAMEDSAFSHCSNLQGILIPDSVQEIGSAAFDHCENLESIVFPSGLKTLASSILRGCTVLKEVRIPDTVEHIGWGAFYACSSLKSIKLPESVVKMDAYVFRECSNLEEVNIPDTVPILGEHVFAECKSLKTLRIPKGVTHIVGYAFDGCTALKEIIFTGDAPTFDADYEIFQNVSAVAYYPENNDTWTADVRQNYGGDIIWLPKNIPLTPSEVRNGVFEYYSQFRKKSAHYTFDYDENWFYNNASSYNHDLARMSIRVAMAAADTGPRMITELFENLCFNNITGNYPSPTSDSIGYVIGSKTVKNTAGETMTLLAVAVRGGGYGAEWASNFKVGTASNHQGFSEAATTVVDGIKAHIEKIGAAENIKIWITGFSRAAATSNITAHRLNLQAREGRIPGLSEDGIFAYCFECPRTVWKSETGNGADKNIFNIVNPIDVVPMVAPEAWDFYRYGITYYIPSNELKYIGYTPAFEAMQAEYEKILASVGGNHLDVRVLTEPLFGGQHKRLTKLVDALGESMQNQLTYCLGFQSDIMAVMSALNNDHVDAGEVIGGLLGIRTLLACPQILALYPVTIVMIDDISHAHYPELCLAWMDSLSGECDFMTEERVRYVSVNCPVDISVYDSSGTLVARILDDVVQEIPGSTIDALLDENGQKVICLPLDEDFDIRVTATDEGTMSYQISETDLDSGDLVRVVNYYDIPIQPGDALNGAAGAAADGVAEYSLTMAGGEVLSASTDLSGDVAEYQVSVSGSGEGTVAGGGLFAPGAYARVTAEASETTVFLGWYQGEELLSRELDYRFRVEEDDSIVGRFAAADFTGDSSVTEDDAIYLIWHTLFPQLYPIPENTADYNGDGEVTDQDAVDLLWLILFQTE